MPAQSKSQQRLFGMVHAYKKGELDLDDLSGELGDKIKKIAKSVSGKEAKAFAKTPHEDLPTRKTEAVTFSRFLKLTETLNLRSGDKVTPTGGEFKGQTGTVVHVGTQDRRWMVTVKFDESGEYWIPMAALERVED